MKHKKVIEEFLRHLFLEDWMDKEDYESVLELTLKGCDTTIQKLSDEIEVGVKNGYTVSKQIELMKQVTKG